MPDVVEVLRKDHDEAIGQASEAEQVMDRLGKLSPDDQRFEELLAGFASDARAHIAFEEAHAWPPTSCATS